ncbi:MAG: DUF3842 family protein [Lachnospiraceae bacterium]|jgi:hypothetical protein|nr:DUF3842 family protein [Lachnospiraceae bacterium]
MNVLIIDAQGGGLGKQIITAIKKTYPSISITAVGTNSVATSNMLKAGADHGATGENAVIVGCRHADIIIAPIGIVIADSMFGEVTPKMAAAVGQSAAKRLLIPINQCSNIILGVHNLSINDITTDILNDLQS